MSMQEKITALATQIGLDIKSLGAKIDFIESDFVVKEQVFSSSGTFTPNAKMIAQGGNCYVLCVGGGQAGYYRHKTGVPLADSEWVARGGAGGRVETRFLSGIKTAQHVAVGNGGFFTVAEQGGVRTITGGHGSASRFGTHVVAWGGGGNEASSTMNAPSNFYGAQASHKGVYMPPHPGMLGYAQGGNVALIDEFAEYLVGIRGSGAGGTIRPGNVDTSNTRPNGSPGVVVVRWWEAI